MITIRMSFYVTITPDKMYHVQNVIMGQLGQHHIHNKKSYDKWKKGIRQENITISEGECNCGLKKSGDVREYDGREWHNKRFET